MRRILQKQGNYVYKVYQESGSKEGFTYRPFLRLFMDRFCSSIPWYSYDSGEHQMEKKRHVPIRRAG